MDAALKLAGTLLPRDPSTAPEVVLFTDGWQTAASTPADLLPAGIAVSYVPVPVSAERPLAVVHRIDAPSVAREGDRIDVAVDLLAAVPVDARLRLWLDQIPVADGPVHLEAGETLLSFPQPIGAPGI